MDGWMGGLIGWRQGGMMAASSRGVKGFQRRGRGEREREEVDVSEIQSRRGCYRSLVCLYIVHYFVHPLGEIIFPSLFWFGGQIVHDNTPNVISCEAHCCFNSH